MLTLFFDLKGIVYKEFVPESETVNIKYYLEVLNWLRARIRNVQPEYREQGSLFLLHNNELSHKPLIIG